MCSNTYWTSLVTSGVVFLGQALYRVVWEENNATWETEETLKHAADKIEDYRIHLRLSRIRVQAKRREKEEERRKAAESDAAR